MPYFKYFHGMVFINCQQDKKSEGQKECNIINYFMKCSFGFSRFFNYASSKHPYWIDPW